MAIERSPGQMSGYQKTITEEIDVTTGQSFYTFAKKVNRFTMQFRELIRTAYALVADLAWPGNGAEPSGPGEHKVLFRRRSLL
jgi:hypothetical protein